MTSVTLNNTSVNELKAMMGEIQSSGQISDVKYGEMKDGIMPMTITVANGTFVINAELPELDPSENGGVDATDKAKVEAAVQDLSADQQDIAPATRQSGLADIYAILSLLYETAQKQRESSMQARAAEHKATQASLEGQAQAAMTAADEAYNQARNSAITQAVTAGISLAASATSFGLQVKATVLSPDVKVAKTDLSTAKGELSTAQALPKGATETHLADHQVGENNPLEGNQQALKARQEYQLADGTVNTREESLNHSKSELNGLEKQMKDDKSALDRAISDHKTPEEIDAKKAKLDNSTKQFRAGQKQVGYDAKALDDAKLARGEKALAYNKELDKAMKANPGDRDLATFAQSDKKILRQPAIDGSRVKCDRAYGKVNEAIAAAEKSGEYLGAKGLDVFSQTSTQIGRTTSAFFEAESQHISGVSQSKAKSAEAEQENLKAQTESTNELCQSEQELINFINDMLKQISQAEGSAVSAAIRV